MPIARKWLTWLLFVLVTVFIIAFQSYSGTSSNSPAVLTVNDIPRPVAVSLQPPSPDVHGNTAAAAAAAGESGSPVSHQNRGQKKDEGMWSMMASRADHARQVCSRLDLRKLRPPAARQEPTVWFNKSISLATCRVYKSATTESYYLIYQLLQGPSLGDIASEGERWRAVTKFIPQHSVLSKSISDFLKSENPHEFGVRNIVVREPFTRFISAYKDKILKMNQYYYGIYGKEILRRYDHIKPPNDANTAKAQNIIPSFSGFVEFSLNRFDAHWLPAFDSCRPCEVEYNSIIKSESAEEFDFFARQILKIAHPKPFRPEQNHTSTSLTAAQYYASVPENLKKRLYQRYELDFKIFNYSYPQYAFK